MRSFQNRAFVMVGSYILLCAAALLCMGGVFAISLYLVIRSAVAAPLEVTARPPVIELKNERMTVLRLQFEVDGRATRDCHFTYFEDSATWRLQC